ncbi:DNA polymerase III subunit gamma/tau [Pseudoalteromonas xiamenensis]
MSYQVLARKWRPQNFHELVGQEHVKQALVNALNEQRLHHAYLFTGTRGVGKTTIARIFSKSLNCEVGITSTPCGKCSACQDIEAGRFIDLIEIDAASRTKVEDTREILDNVQYAPTRGRYKVYLIDEVHMLSKHSFNALLKTLEEPPTHVKFLLATTDPQKLPVTILSRCLQFNLSALSKGEITAQLTSILNAEGLIYEPQALDVLAKAADGSMRDALSLTDQAIAQTNGNLELLAVQSMLGLMDSAYAAGLLSAVLVQDGAALMAEIERVGTRAPSYKALVDDMLALTHAIQLAQLVPESVNVAEYDKEEIMSFASNTTAIQIQSIYQLLLNGKKDLQWAPEPKLGFEMLMLRVLAFEQSGIGRGQNTHMPQATSTSVGESKASALRAILGRNKANAAQQPQSKSAPSMDANLNETEPKAIEKNAEAQTGGLPINQTMTPNQSQVETVGEGLTTDLSSAESLDADDEGVMSYQQQEQYESLMAQASEQGFTADNTPIEVQSSVAQASASPSMAETLQQKSQQTQSAIARILQNRQIQGAEKLKPEATPTKKSETVGEPTDTTAQAKVKKVDFRERHRVDESKLAPELLVQLSGEKAPQLEEQEQVIPVPENFESPISDIRFAHQQDRWAELIELMGLGGRSRQFALHSIFNQQGNRIELQVDSTQQHLDGTMLRTRLADNLSRVLNTNIELEVSFAPGIMESPYLIQQKIDAGRLAQAVEVIANDQNIVTFTQEFGAVVDENSIRAL